ncbi:hypothetical protein ACP4OV_010006 [Aristida adscensionis]
MASSAAGYCCVVLAVLLAFSPAYGQLSENYYASKCPSLDLGGIVRKELNKTLPSDPRMGASLLRLHFHDCLSRSVGSASRSGACPSELEPAGCDASVLLDDDASRGIDSEKNASPNANSLRGFDVIDRIKAAVEANCSHAVSCADILAVAAREAVVALGGQGWTVRLGRRDSTTASRAQAEADLPSPDSGNTTLLAAFAKKGFTSSWELAALSGAHTVGRTQCQFADNPGIVCLLFAPSSLQPLDVSTPDRFDNAYYGELVKGNGVLHSDRVLVDGELGSFVRSYGASPALFAADFAKAMVKMSELGALTGASGQIRLNCNKLN